MLKTSKRFQQKTDITEKMSHGFFLYVIIFCCIHSPKKLPEPLKTFVKFIHLSNPPQSRGVSSPHHGFNVFFVERGVMRSGGTWRQAGRAMQLRGGSFRMCPVPEDLDVSVKVSSLSNPNGKKTHIFFFLLLLLFFFVVFFSLFYYWMRTPGFWTGVISFFGKERFDIYIYISLYTYIYIYTLYRYLKIHVYTHIFTLFTKINIP